MELHPIEWTRDRRARRRERAINRQLESVYNTNEDMSNAEADRIVGSTESIHGSSNEDMSNAEAYRIFALAGSTVQQAGRTTVALAVRVWNYKGDGEITAGIHNMRYREESAQTPEN